MCLLLVQLSSFSLRSSKAGRVRRNGGIILNRPCKKCTEPEFQVIAPDHSSFNPIFVQLYMLIVVFVPVRHGHHVEMPSIFQGPAHISPAACGLLRYHLPSTLYDGSSSALPPVTLATLLKRVQRPEAKEWTPYRLVWVLVFLFSFFAVYSETFH